MAFRRRRPTAAKVVAATHDAPRPRKAPLAMRAVLTQRNPTTAAPIPRRADSKPGPTPYSKYRTPRARIARAPGSNTARSASAAPAGPFKLLPRKTERFETVGSGKSWLRVRPGRNSAPLSQVRRTTSAS